MGTPRESVHRREKKSDQVKQARNEPEDRIERLKMRGVPIILSESVSWTDGVDDMLQILFDLNPFWTTLSTYEEGCILKANRAFYNFTGFSENEVIGKTSLQLGLWPSRKERQDAMQVLSEKKLVNAFPINVCTKSGELRDSIGSACLVRISNGLCLLTVVVEKNGSPGLTWNPGERGGGLMVAMRQFEEIRMGIQTLLDCSNQKKSFNEKISTIFKKNIVPFIEKLKMTKLDRKAKAYLAIIETNLSTLLSSFPHTEPDPLIDGLSPAEIHIIELIRQGKTSKEIASLLNVSPSTIAFHRSNIRKKLDLHNKKMNLNSYLLSR
jgi:PAS domain S-box-containing protein